MGIAAGRLWRSCGGQQGGAGARERERDLRGENGWCFLGWAALQQQAQGLNYAFIFLLGPFHAYFLLLFTSIQIFFLTILFISSSFDVLFFSSQFLCLSLHMST
jgi:hypothetical protein